MIKNNYKNTLILSFIINIYIIIIIIDQNHRKDNSPDVVK